MGSQHKTVLLNETVDNLVMNKRGRIVSKTKYVTAKKEKRLEKHD